MCTLFAKRGDWGSFNMQNSAGSKSQRFATKRVLRERGPRARLPVDSRYISELGALFDPVVVASSGDLLNNNEVFPGDLGRPLILTESVRLRRCSSRLKQLPEQDASWIRRRANEGGVLHNKHQ